MRHDIESPGTPPDGRPMDQQPRWRQDFPIDVPQDNYVARRDFTKFMVLTSFAFVVGQLWIGVQNMIRRRRGKPVRKRIARVDQLAVYQALTFAYPGEHDACILVRLGNSGGVDDFVAFSQKCTHLACAVLPDMKHHHLHCPCHEGYFDLTTGQPTAGPPRRPLPRVRLTVLAGAVYATDLEIRSA